MVAGPADPHRPAAELLPSPAATPADDTSASYASILAAPFRIAPGFGMRVLSADDRGKVLQNLGEHPGPLNFLQVWEPPRRNKKYVISVDVATGAELDFSVVEVTRVGDLYEGDEQVAQFVTNDIDEITLAYVIDPIGRLYKDSTMDLPAVVAIECNGMGISTQSELLRHIGYPNLFIWQYEDAVKAESRYTNRYGWYTNSRTRPIMLNRYVHAIKTVDPHTGFPDYRVNSPWTISEMATFATPGPLWMAAASEGAHDDCIMAGAIGVHVAQTMHFEERETVHEARRRLSEEAARVASKAEILQRNISPQTTDVSYDELMGRDEGWDSGEVEHYL